jgi:hypothetical protein
MGIPLKIFAKATPSNSAGRKLPATSPVSHIFFHRPCSSLPLNSIDIPLSIRANKTSIKAEYIELNITEKVFGKSEKVTPPAEMSLLHYHPRKAL